MIDYVVVVLPFRHEVPITSGERLLHRPDGEVDFLGDDFVQVRGPYGHKVAVQTSRGPDPLTGVWMSGNPSKFLQGHNAFGSNDLPRLVAATAALALPAAGQQVYEEDLLRWSAGHFTLSRVDIAEHFALDSQEDCSSAIRHIGRYGRIARAGEAAIEEGTVYFLKRSRRWTLKFYSKFDEMRISGHEPPLDLPNRDAILEVCRGDLRAELRLSTMELTKLGLRHGSAWLGLDAREVFRRYIGKLSVPPQRILRVPDLDGLRSPVRMAYAAWRAGGDLAAALPEPTFRRYRKLLLPLGVDLASPPRDEMAQAVDYSRLFQREPKPVPEWARLDGLFV